MEEGLFPHARSVDDDDDVEEERRICYVCITRARERLILTGAARRRVFGEYQATTPSRFLDELPAELMRRVEPVVQAPRWQSGYELRNPYANRGSRHRSGIGTKTDRAFSYESEDQSDSGIRSGMRVKHRQFGTGTVLEVEEHGDDYKVTVRFPAVGVKKLLARFAGLEPA
jgi:DNA helicase-2/ATP-dependent DNA helicase PcrA